MADDSASPSDDRRSHPRAAARIEVRFAEADQAARALRAYSLNLSAGGLCLRTRRAYPIGTRLDLSMNIGGQTLEVVGVVSWARSGAIGVRFEDLSTDDRTRLQTLAASLPKAS